MNSEERAFEEQKLKLERRKVRMTALGAVVALSAVIIPLWVQASAAKEQANAEKIAVLANTGSQAECTRLANVPTVEDSFWPGAPDRLSGETVDLATHFCNVYFGKFQSEAPIEAQQELIRQLAGNPGQLFEIIAMWEALYPDQEWVGRVGRAMLDARDGA